MPTVVQLDDLKGNTAVQGVSRMVSPASSPTYGLAQELRAHSDDVKCVIPAGEGVIVSASRDSTVGIWRQDEAGVRSSFGTVPSPR